MEAVRGVVLAGRPSGTAASGYGPGAGLLFPLANRPLVTRALESLRRMAVREAVVVVCARTSAAVRAEVADGSAWGLRVSYVEQPEPLGQAAALLAAEERLGGEPFVLHRADGFVVGDDHRHAACFAEAGVDALLLVHRVAEAGGHTTVELDGPRVRGLVPDAPAEDGAGLALAGVAVLGPRIFGALHAIAPSWRGRLELADALALMVREGADVRIRPVPGWWRLGDDPAELLEGNRLALAPLATGHEQAGSSAGVVTEGAVRIDPTAQLEGVLVRGPAVIGPGARLVDAYVGPFTSIGADVTIEGAEIENSVVVDGATIRHVPGRLEGSVIGTHARVVREFALPRTVRVRIAGGAEVSLV